MHIFILIIATLAVYMVSFKDDFQKDTTDKAILMFGAIALAVIVLTALFELIRR